MARDRYKRATDLFEVAEVLQPDREGPLYYVVKLNSFQTDEVRTDASTRRSLVTMAMRKEGSDEVLALTDACQKFSKDQLADGIVAGKYTEFVSKASNSVHADPKWLERLDMLDRIRNLEELPDDQRDVMADLNSQYLAEIQKRMAERETEAKDDLMRMSDEDVRAAYIDTFIDSRGTSVFMREMRYGEVLFGVRECDAKDVNGNWDHNECKHVPVYESYEEVRQIPDELLDLFSRAFDRLNVPGRQAKDSASRRASSEPSRPPSEEEPSTPSTQEVTSPEQAGTSA